MTAWVRACTDEFWRDLVKIFAGLAAALILAMAPIGPVAPASAAVEQWETFHGCVVTFGEDYVVIRVRAAGAGPNGLHRFGLTGATAVETGLTGDACIAVVAWKEDGEWYAQSIVAEHQEDGTVEVTTRRRGPA